jgi:putative endonuclease
MSAFLFIVRCADSSYYVGSTRDSLEMRVAQHNAAAFDGYTARRRPVQLVFHQEFSHITDAMLPSGKSRVGGARRRRPSFA